MEKNNKCGKTFGEVIEEAILRIKEETEGTEEEMKQVKEQIKEMEGEKEMEREKEVEGEKDNVIELRRNTELFKTTLTMAESLMETIEFAKREGRKISIVSMSEILTGILVVLEKRDFIRIIREEERR